MGKIERNLLSITVGDAKKTIKAQNQNGNELSIEDICPTRLHGTFTSHKGKLVCAHKKWTKGEKTTEKTKATTFNSEKENSISIARKILFFFGPACKSVNKENGMTPTQSDNIATLIHDNTLKR